MGKSPPELPGPGPGGPGGFGPGPEGPGGPPPFGPPGGGPGGGPFGPGSSILRVDFLWFLWYLLVFLTISPLLVAGARLLVGRWPGRVDLLGQKVLGLGLAPVVLGLVSGPLLMMVPGGFGWSLGLATGIFRGVPEFLYHAEPDMPFYLAYFLTGWWLYSLHGGLPKVANVWLVNLVLGLAAHAAAGMLSSSFAMHRDLPHYDLIRLGGYVLYALGSAFTAFGVLGFFQRYIDRPTRTGRYLADTAFWVYLVHEPILIPLLRVFTPLGLAWWIQGPVVAILASAAALVLYELIVRPTPMVRLFGPANAVKPPAVPSAQAPVLQANEPDANAGSLANEPCSSA